MNAGAVILLVAIYLVGCWVSFLINGIALCVCGIYLAGRILFWPLFAAKLLLLTVRASALDLAGRAQ